MTSVFPSSPVPLLLTYARNCAMFLPAKANGRQRLPILVALQYPVTN